MQEGSLRVDANVNLHIHTPQGTVPTPIVEVKNMNSFRAVERALAYEAQRQFEVWQQSGKRLGEVPKQTRGWDESRQATFEQRSKEESSDYRYFPEPDLVPVIVTEEEIAEVRASLGELPAALRTRLEQTYGISAYDSDVLVNQGRALVDYFLAVAEACGDGKLAANWIQQDVLRVLNERQIGIEAYPVPAEALAALLLKVRQGEIQTSRAREVLARMIQTGQPADEVIASLGLRPVDDQELRRLCEELLAANPKIVADLKAGRLKAVGGLVGQAKKRNPNVNPARVQALCLELVGQMP